MAKVSVIIPNYNHAKYLQQRIDSVLNQTYSDFEVIILDDCSTDNSKEIIERHRQNEKISHIIYNTENSGSTFKQWDKGINIANGKYVWIAESDDWCEKNLLEILVTGLEKKSDTAFGYCQSFCLNNEGGIIFQSNYHKLEDHISSNIFLEYFLCDHNAVYNASMAVFKRDLFLKISKTYQSFKFTGDWIFWAELSRLGVVYVNARPLNYFRKHIDDVSSRMYRSGQNFVEELRMLNYFHDNLRLNNSAFVKAKIKLYGRFIKHQRRIEPALKQQVKSALFSNLSFLQKQYFLALGRAYNLKKKLNLAFNVL